MRRLAWPIGRENYLCDGKKKLNRAGPRAKGRYGVLNDKCRQKEKRGKECFRKIKCKIILVIYFAFYFYGNRLASQVVAKGND